MKLQAINVLLNRSRFLLLRSLYNIHILESYLETFPIVFVCSYLKKATLQNSKQTGVNIPASKVRAKIVKKGRVRTAGVHLTLSVPGSL